MSEKTTQPSQLIKIYRAEISEFQKALMKEMHRPINFQTNWSHEYVRQIMNEIHIQNRELLKSMPTELSKCIRHTLHECTAISYADILREALKDTNFQNLSSWDSYVETGLDSQLFGDKEEDYVTADESLIREIDITETITIPFGNNRIKMKTEHCITLLIALVSAIWILCTHFNNADEAQATDQSAEQESSLTEQEILKILDGFLDSIDTSNSSDADSVEYWKGYAQGLLSNQFESPELPDILHSELPVLQDTAPTDESVVSSEDCPSQLQSEPHGNCPKPTGIENISQNNESAENK